MNKHLKDIITILARIAVEQELQQLHEQHVAPEPLLKEGNKKNSSKPKIPP